MCSSTGRIIPYMKWKIKFMFQITNQFPTKKHLFSISCFQRVLKTHLRLLQDLICDGVGGKNRQILQGHLSIHLAPSAKKRQKRRSAETKGAISGDVPSWSPLKVGKHIEDIWNTHTHVYNYIIKNTHTHIYIYILYMIYIYYR